VTDRYARQKGTPVPSGRGARLFQLGGMVAGIAGGVVAGGLRQMASGKRPDLADLVLSPANALRLTSGLSQMRGAALKLGQMLSMDTGIVLPAELTEILSSLRADVRHMPAHQLRGVLDAEWGNNWQSRFSQFDHHPFAAASIGQVHRARTTDGRLLAVKVQYPGVRASIDSDVDNIATLLRLPGLLPGGVDISPLLRAAKQQLHEEADYAAEAVQLRRFAAHLAGSETFLVPEVQEDFCTSRVLAMSFVAGRSIETLEHAGQETRDWAAAQLIDLVLRELFEFRAMQTDPNLANYAFDPASRRLVLLDFGAVRTVDERQSEDFRTLLNAGLDGDRQRIREAMLAIGYFGPATGRNRQELIQRMFDMAMAPLRQEAPFDFGRSDLLARLRDMGLAIGSDRELMHVPPADTLFLHRKIGGMYLLATRLKARVGLRSLVERYR